MRHDMKLAAIPFAKIKNGQKTVESRLFDEKRRRVSVGDEIVFASNDDASNTVAATVVALHQYPDFTSLMTSLPAEKFGWTKAEDAIAEIGNFYSLEDVAANGVVGIEIALR